MNGNLMLDKVIKYEQYILGLLCLIDLLQCKTIESNYLCIVEGSTYLKCLPGQSWDQPDHSQVKHG